ncbi:MAG: AzlC family ABC transporter permease [Clostridia bacterium]|nr:AzlC family ABC transporter permease [Clostridia bacterium]
MAGYIVLGMGFGVLLSTKGYGPLWALAMSGFIYAGSMQYLAIDLLTGGASLITSALTTLLVNARHLFYGISMVEGYRGMGKKKPYAIFALTDETYSLVCQDKHPTQEERHQYAFLVSVLNQCWWVGGSLIGSLLGEVIPFDVTGIDFALTALFVTVFIEQWLSTRDHASAIIGVAASVGCLMIFGADSFLIPAMASILLALSILRIVRKEAAHG